MASLDERRGVGAHSAALASKIVVKMEEIMTFNGIIVQLVVRDGCDVVKVS